MPGEQRIVVLDRDGVINHDSPDFIRKPSDWQPLAGSLAAIARLHAAGWIVVVVSNQSGVGRGLFSMAELGQIHARMVEAIREAGGELGAIVFCPHHPAEGCACRKPRPGLFRQVEQQLDTSLAGAPAIGDSVRDIEAALAAGASPILVRTGNGAASEAEVLRRWPGMPVYPDLAAAVDALLAS
ncbi:MAG: D-glycero-beta-D-manno-heptose 1,7-bisphosphate 7-phosphatase [Chromatiales bacterium]|nr:D-glycero-beta-D-manno-heptose 1,7-bisphosphate 7-phosphatase [Chromatiales bacterium]